MVTSPPPVTLPLDAKGIPESLRARSWVVWRWTLDEKGKPTKPPYWAGEQCPLNLRERDRGTTTYGRPTCQAPCAKAEHLAATDNPGSWTTFDVAQRRVDGVRYCGAGLVVASPYLVVDFDACVNPHDRSIEPWARHWVQRLASYTEYSVSLTGLHVVVLADAPWPEAGGSKKVQVPDVPCHGAKDAAMVELMTHTRYVCMTGVTPAGFPSDVRQNQEAVNALWEWLQTLHQERQEQRGESARRPAANVAASPDLEDSSVVARARDAANGAKFALLFDHGDLRAYGGDDSAADLALCSLLAFWTQDEAQLDRIFRSGRLMRPKWDQRHAADGSSYGSLTIRKALSLCTEHYGPLGAPASPNGNGHAGPADALPSHTSLTSHSRAPGESGLSSHTSLTSHNHETAEPPLSSHTSLTSHLSGRPQLDKAALYGLAGDIVRCISPHTEAHEAALLITLLVYFGNIITSGPHARVTSKRHGTNLFAALVGRTSGSRKGTSRAEIDALFGRIDADWLDARVQTGLSSGEGLISAVRDPVRKHDPQGDSVVLDEGVLDKRLVVVEEEFCAPIKLMAREGNTLSAVVRQAWDGHNLGTLTRHNPMTATRPHVSIIGHTTQTELLKYLNETEMADGFANRFLWLCVEKSKPLPHGGGQVDYGGLAKRLADAISFARSCTAQPVARDAQANTLWERMYPQLTTERIGLFGAVTSRAEAQALRLSVIYALLDRSRVVTVPHLAAALALWEYCQDSARTIFGAATGDDVADRILGALNQAGPEGIDLEAMTILFNRHLKAARRDAALSRLSAAGLAHWRQVQTDGRPRTVYYAGPADDPKGAK